MSDVDFLIAQSRRKQVDPVKARPDANPFGEQSFTGGFLESAFSSLPELVGYDPTPGAVAFRAANPVSGFVSQVLPAIGPYGGMYALSQTARGAAALSKGMQGAKAVGTALGMQTVNRPVIAGAVKEMLRYSPLELGRLGVGAVVNPENTGELFADVALSTLFEGALGGVGGLLRSAGHAKRPTGDPRVVGQDNQLVHPVYDLRALRQPEALTKATTEQIQTEAELLTSQILNDKPLPKSYIGRTRVPLFGQLEDADPQTSLGVEVLFRPNKSEVKERGIDRRKLVEGAADDSTTLNAGELEQVVTQAGFKDAAELAENTLQARLITLHDERSLPRIQQLIDSGAFKKFGDDAWAARTEFGSHIVMKRLPRAVDEAPTKPVEIDPKQKEFDLQIAKDLDNEAAGLERITARRTDTELVRPPWGDASPMPVKQLKEMAASKRIEAFDIRKQYKGTKPAPKISRQKSAPSAPKGIFQAGDRILLSHTDRPGAYAPEMKKLDAVGTEAMAAMQRVYQPMTHQPHVYNKAMDEFVHVFTPENVAFMQNNLRQTAVAGVMKNLRDRGVRMAGLEDSVALRDFVDKAYDVFSPAMFKDRRNTLFARFSGILSHTIRTADTATDNAVFGQLERAPGARTALNRGFERRGVDGLTIEEAIGKNGNEGLSPEGFDALIKIMHAPVNSVTELKKIKEAGLVSQEDLARIERVMKARSDFDHEFVIAPIETLGREHNYNFMEGYIGPRLPLGDWSVRVSTEGKNNLFWLATGRTAEQAQTIAKAIIDEGSSRGVKLQAGDPVARHAIEMKNDEMLDIMRKVGEQYATNPTEMDDLVAAAMKRVRFVGTRRERMLPYRAKAPGTLANERTGVPMNTIEYTKKELIQHIHADMQRKARFAAVTTYMDRWGHELLSKLRPQNAVLYEDVNRRAMQALGIEGTVTKFINQKLSKIPGLSGKAGTTIAANLNKTLFAFQLGILQPTYALLNALSPLQTVLPQVAFILRAPQEVAANMFQFMPIKNSAGKTVALGGALDPIRVMWQATKMMNKLDDEAAEVMLQLRRQGTIQPHIFEEQTVRIPQSLKESFKSGGYAEFTYDAMTAMARNSESFARIISANAGYIVGKNHLGLQGDKLVHFTRKFVESTNYLYGQSDRARIITGPLGSTFGLFKNWQMHFLGMMASYAGVAIKHGTFAPLMWQSAAAITLGGLGATPLRHLADGLANFHDENTDSFLYMQENWGKAADMVWFGPMGALGITLQASSTIPGTDVRNDLQFITNSIVFERAKQLGGVVGDGISHYRATGQNPLADPNIRDRLLAAGAPRAVSRAASVVEGNYVKSMGTGYPMMQEPSATARWMHGLGINNVEIEKQQIAARQLYKDQEWRKGQITSHGSQIAQALAAQDYDAVQRIEISAVAKGLELDRVYQSAMNFERREEGDLLNRYKGERSERYRGAFGQ